MLMMLAVESVGQGNAAETEDHDLRLGHLWAPSFKI